MIHLNIGINTDSKVVDLSQSAYAIQMQIQFIYIDSTDLNT